MKPFSFRLERVLDYRKFQEQKALGELIRMRNEYNGIKKTVERMALERSAIARTCSAEGQDGIDAFRLQIYISFMQKLASDIERGNIELKDTETKVRNQQAAVKTETTQKKALETLRDFRFKNYQEQVVREEQKVLDELAINQRWVQT